MEEEREDLTTQEMADHLRRHSECQITNTYIK